LNVTKTVVKCFASLNCYIVCVHIIYFIFLYVYRITVFDNDGLR